MFTTAPEPGLNGRALAYPRGKVIGGSSAINAMIYMRGQAADYDGWRQLGLTGWGWDDVLPFFLKHEDHADWRNAFHAQGGEWRGGGTPLLGGWGGRGLGERGKFGGGARILKKKKQ